MSNDNYFSFQGKVYLGTRLPSGKPGALRWINDAGKLEVALSTDTDEKTESYSGNRLTAARLPKAKKATITLSMEIASAENLALGLYSKVNKNIGGTVTSEILPDALVAGDNIALDHTGVTALVLTDSTVGTPKTLASGTSYNLDSPANGIVQILDITTPVGLTQPFKAAYTYAASVNLAMFTQTAPERYLVLDGVNTVDGSRVRVSLFRAQFDPMSALPLINEGFGSLEFKGSVLFDPTNAANANLGGFGRIELPGN